MASAADIRKISCYAVLRSGLSTYDYLEAHMRLVLLLIYRKQYRTIEIPDLVDDFESEFGYKINYYAMRSILGIALSKEYLTKKNYFGRYRPTSKIHEFASMEEEIIGSESKYAQLVSAFKEFVQRKGVNYDDKKASSIIIAYVDAQKLEHFSGHIEAQNADGKIDYLFGSFILSLKESKSPLLEYVTAIVTGSILADCLTFHENELTTFHSLEEITIVFDAPPVFLMLGIDTAGRTQYYQSLLESTKQKGAKCAIFKHTYDEMAHIISSAAKWMENPEYDRAKSSETIEYFRNQGASRDDVEEYGYNLKQKITNLGIDIIDAEYSKDNFRFVIDEGAVYDAITKYYRETNPYFDEVLQRATIEIDVKSISKIHILRAGQRPVYIPDCNYIFVSSNCALCKIANEYYSKIDYKNTTIPCLMTDAFFGTYLWLSDPIQIVKMNQEQIISNAMLAFQPNTKVLHKLSATINKLRESGEITSEQCYALKGSRLVSEKLMEKTLGDPEAISDATPLEILQAIRNDGKTEGIAEGESRLADFKLKAEAEAVLYREQYEREKATIKQNAIEEKIRLINITLPDKVRRRDELLFKRTKAEQSQIHVRNLIVMLMIGITVVFLGGLLSQIFGRDNSTVSLFANVCTIVPIVIFLINLALSMITTHSFDLSSWLKSFPEKYYKHKCTKLGFTNDELVKLNSEIEQLEDELNKYTEL